MKPSNWSHCHWFRRHHWWRHTMLGLPPWAPEFFAFRSLNFSLSESQSECDGILCDFTWFLQLQMTWNDLIWPQWRHVMAIEVECLSRSKNRSVTGSLTVTWTSSIRIKNFTYRVQASKVITKSSDWMKFWPMRAWLEWNLIHRF